MVCKQLCPPNGKKQGRRGTGGRCDLLGQRGGPHGLVKLLGDGALEQADGEPVHPLQLFGHRVGVMLARGGEVAVQNELDLLVGLAAAAWSFIR